MNIIFEKASTNSYIVGKDTDFIKDLVKSCLVNLIYLHIQYSIEKKAIIAQIAVKIYPIDKLFKVTEIKLRYGFHPNLEDARIVKELVIDSKEFDIARSFI